MLLFALRRGSGPPEQALEHDAWIDLHRHRRRRRRPRDRVHVGAAVLCVAAADVAGEVLCGEFERRQRRFLSDFLGDDLIDGFAAVDIFGECLLRKRTAQPRRYGRRMSVERIAQLRDDRDVLTELLDRFENRSEFEVRSDGGRRPVPRPLAERDEHRSEATRRVGGGLDGLRQGRNHRVEERQGQGGAHPTENRPTR
jgi:hypothetical protein